MWETPLKRRSISTRLHGATSQKTVIFILAAVRTWNLIYVFSFSSDMWRLLAANYVILQHTIEVSVFLCSLLTLINIHHIWKCKSKFLIRKTQLCFRSFWLPDSKFHRKCSKCSPWAPTEHFLSPTTEYVRNFLGFCVLSGFKSPLRVATLVTGVERTSFCVLSGFKSPLRVAALVTGVERT
jgi:hypothetical protein